ncbi:MAG: hypothetical protein WAM88_13950 [Nitrososphaeraceae archaeon]|jgi:hypothetical protein
MLTVHVPRLPYFLTIAYLAADILVELAEMTGCVGIEDIRGKGNGLFVA